MIGTHTHFSLKNNRAKCPILSCLLGHMALICVIQIRVGI